MPNGNSFRQSMAYWCLADTEWQWSAEQICQLAVNLGMKSVELAPPETFPLLKKKGLKCALSSNGMPGEPFARGLNNLDYHEEVIASTKESIDLCSEYEFPNVIAFTGYAGLITLEECIRNCVTGLSELAPYAASKGVTLCLEHLNTRDSSHPMKGHPGYQGDDIEVCAEIVRKVNSPSVRLLFDFYHVQVMHGDIIRRMRACQDVIGHVHTAGCPGRNEFDDRQEIHYPGVVTALQDIGYDGYVGHEFIPKGDPTEAFKQAVELFEI